MTEMAPVGYVGVSPKCVLGFNKVNAKNESKSMNHMSQFSLLFLFVSSLFLSLQNHGEEISLRLRTDDLKGFRKYESIKKTLLHELVSFFPYDRHKRECVLPEVPFRLHMINS